MNRIHKQFSNQFRTQWFKIKFYREKPDINNVKRLEKVRFCQAIKDGVLYPVILDKESINCPGALYAFGWQNQQELIEHCKDKINLSGKELDDLISQQPRFKKPFKYIGINMEGEPDLIVSNILPRDAMDLINLYHRKTGKILNVSLCSMMSVCSGIAVKTFLENQITFSFGCMDSREYGQIDRSRLVVGVPKKFFHLVKTDV